jgi:hypothetical protein
MTVDSHSLDIAPETHEYIENCEVAHQLGFEVAYQWI